MKINRKLLDKSAYYVIGVSGGCDSMALLNAMHQMGYHLLVAHVNYNYRHDSYEDYELVSDFCFEKGIPFFYKEFHQKAKRPTKRSRKLPRVLPWQLQMRMSLQ